MEIKKSRAVIQRSADDWGHTLLPANRVQAAKSPLKGSLSKGAYLNVLVFLSSSTFRHMYTEAGARSHTSFLVCICLAVFIVLSLCSVRTLSLSLSVSCLCFIATSTLCSPVTIHFYCAPITRLSSPKKSPLVLDNFKMTR